LTADCRKSGAVDASTVGYDDAVSALLGDVLFEFFKLRL
jgi:hypothetical protein